MHPCILFFLSSFYFLLTLFFSYLIFFFPAISQWIYICYRLSSSHSHRDKGLHQDTGLHQGQGQECRGPVARDLHRDLQLRLPGPQGRQGLVPGPGPGTGLGQIQGQGLRSEREQVPGSGLGQGLAPGLGLSQGLGVGVGVGPSEESEQGLALCSIALGLAGITQTLGHELEPGAGLEPGPGVRPAQGLEPGLERRQELAQPVSVLPAYFARQLLLAAYRFVTQVNDHPPPLFYYFSISTYILS